MVQFNLNEYEKKYNEYINVRKQLTKNDLLFNDNICLTRRYLVDNYNNVKKIYTRDDNKYSLFLINYVSIYSDIGSELLYKNKYIENDRWNIEIIKKAINSSQLKQIFIYYEKSIECINEIKNVTADSQSEDILKPHCKRFGLSYTHISMLYYFFGNYEKFEYYADIAVAFGSVNSASNLLKYYADKDDFFNANRFYKELLKEKTTDNYKITINSFNIMYNYLISKGEYKAAIIVNNDYRDYIKLFDNSRKVTKNKEEKGKLYSIFDSRELECNKKIKESIEIKIDDNVLRKYYAQNIIDLMSEDIKIYIITTIDVYKHLNESSQTLDYSAALMPIMKGVESILFEIFVNKYIKFINKKNNIIFENITKNFKYYNKTKKIYKIKNKMNKVYYYDAINSMGDKYNGNHWIINEYFKEFYFLHKQNNSFDKDTQQILDKLDYIKNKRNLVAHKDRILKSDATECIKELIEEYINFIRMLYTYFDFCFVDND